MTTKTRTTVKVDGVGPLADAIRGREDELAAMIDGVDDAAPRTEDGAFGDQIRMFDGYEVKLVELALGGKVRLWLTDDLHAAIINDARILHTAAITITVAGHQLECLGTITAKGVASGTKGLVETLKVKATSSLGESGHEIEDDAGDGENTGS